MRILSAAEMREVERRAIEELGIPGVVLMENAALGVVEAALREVPAAESAIVFCGPGNNGGDGLAIARQLVARGLRATALIATGGRDYQGDARIQFEVANRMAGSALEVRVLAADAEIGELGLERSDFHLVIDALFGTGLSRPLTGQFADLAAAINSLELPTIAVDLPSGLDADRPEPPGPHVEADLTVTFAALKPAHVFPPASEAAGIVAVSDLGIPGELVEQADGDLFLVDSEDLEPLLAPRARNAHKGDLGHLLIVAGSPGKSGAAVLSSRAAVRTGAGLVTAAVPDSILGALASGSIESMAVGVACSDRGAISLEAQEALEREQEGKQALAVGPGLGSASGTFEMVRRLCLASELPLVLDADGLNAFAGRLAELAKRPAPTVLTPHPGELGRLLGVPTSEVVANRLELARKAARDSGAVVVVKGHLTLIAEAGRGVWVNPTGNPGMATGGTGDVLTGMIGALLAEGMEPLDAARLGVFVHGLAGDEAAASWGERSLAAGDLIESIGAAFDGVAGWSAGAAAPEAGA